MDRQTGMDTGMVGQRDGHWDGQIGTGINEGMDRWTLGQVGAWTGGCRLGWTKGWTDGQMDAGMDGWTLGWMEGWTN